MMLMMLMMRTKRLTNRLVKMYKTLTTWTTIYLLVDLLMDESHSHTLKCPKLLWNGCRCLNFNDIDFLCPSPGNHSIDLKIYRNLNVNLQCVNESAQYVDLLPNVDLPNCQRFNIEFCSLYAEIRNILEKLHINKLKYLSFENIKPMVTSNKTDDDDDVVVTKELFSSLEDLKGLSFAFISSSNVTFVKDFLQNTPNLLYLTLTQVGLVKISFDFVSKLKRLDLSMNQISTLPNNGAFKSLGDLVNLHLDNNKISMLTKLSFEGLKNLELLDLSKNNIQELPEDTFKGLVNLKQLSLKGNKITTLYSNSFRSNNLLEIIMLQANNLTNKIPAEIFQNCTKLQQITLNENKLMLALPNNLFQGLQALKKLDLSSNQLTSLQRGLFSSQRSLESLNLSYNKIEGIIDISIFKNLSNLKKLDMHCNAITAITMEDHHVDDLSINVIILLDLSHNKISQYPAKISRLKIQKLDLSFNQIDYVKVEDFFFIGQPIIIPSHIDLSNNRIKQVLDFRLSTPLTSLNSHHQSLINLDHNSISCDCSNYDLVRYNNGQLKDVKALISFSQKGILCPNNRTFIELKPRDIECLSPNYCPHPCVCLYKPYNGDAIVNCSSNGLKVFSMKHLADEVINVTYLDLSNNLLSEVDWIPPYVKELNLNDNKIKHLTPHFISLLKETHTLERLHLKGNPWDCGCGALKLQNYLKQHFEKVNSSEIYCQNLQAKLINIKNICTTSLFISTILPHLLALFLCFAVAFAIYYRYQKQIKIYLFAKNICSWLISEEELDDDKTYDVFISYSQLDEKFVVEQLLPELEHGEKPFKVCIHIRDWVPGKLITEQIFESVKNSRRTIVVLSNNFVKSVWGKLEFRAAHTEAIAEGRARVVVVVYGDLDEAANLDEELRNYLKTNTYVKWGDKYFWNKLRYALPHHRSRSHNNNNNNNSKSHHIEKTTETISSVCTRPTIILDPSLLLES